MQTLPMLDHARFAEACARVLRDRPAGQLQQGVGTLGEKTLHAVLKHYYEPRRSHHEVQIGRYVADVAHDGHILEVQSQGFGRLREKLAHFLQYAQVTVVYPIPATKWLIWIDPETGVCTGKRKSPKQGQFYTALTELVRIKPLLLQPGLRFRLVLVDLEEQRWLSGWSADKKRGSTRCERIPVALADELELTCPADYLRLIPAELPPQFTSANYKQASGLSRMGAQAALNTLWHVGAALRVGKQGNSIVYRRAALSPV